MGSVIKFFKDTYGKTSVWGAVKAGGWRNLFDGNHAETMLIHTPGAKYVGSDEEGNKYFENMSEQYGRHRWVVFTRLDWTTGQDATRVPASWHGWLHGSTDENPTQPSFPKAAIYGLPQKGYVSGTPAAFKPKGVWENPQKRNWKKVAVWQP
eukprot:jgi/Botrbrau1/22575/Bobra.176_1s0008.1